MVPTPRPSVNPPVLDARPDTTPTVSTAPTVPAAETPVNPPVADARAPKLIQTGQLNWPVPVLAGAGHPVPGGWRDPPHQEERG